MTILQISPQLPFPPIDGGKNGIWGILNSISTEGDKVIFICYVKSIPSKDIINKIKGIATPYFVYYNTTNSVFGLLGNWFSSVPYNMSKYKSLKFKKAIRNIIENEKIDILHIDHLHMAWIGLWVKQNYNIPFVIRSHNIESQILERYVTQLKSTVHSFIAKRESFKCNLYEPKMLNQADGVIFISKNDQQKAFSMGYSGQSTIIPASVSSELFNVTRKNEKKYSLVHIGPLSWYPNIDGLQWFLYEVYPELIKLYPTVHLYIYGKDTNLISFPVEFENNISNIGFIDNLWDEIADKQLAIVPLRIGGGIRIKLLELMATGFPVITTTIGVEGIPVTHDVEVFIADRKEEWISGIRLLFESNEKRHNLSTNGKSFMVSGYSEKEIGISYINYYKNVISNIFAN